MRKDSKASKSATKDDLAMLSVTEGCRNFAVPRVSDCSPSIDKEKLASSNILKVAQEDLVDKRSGVILKAQDIASTHATPRVQDMLSKDISTGNEAINVPPNKLGTASEDSRVFPKLLSLAYDVPEKRATAAGNKVDEAISSSKIENNYNRVPCLSIGGDTDGGIFPLSSLQEKKRLAFKARLELRQTESPPSSVAATCSFQKQSGASEVPSDCKLNTENIVEDMKAKNNCEPVQIQITPEVTNKRPLAPTHHICSCEPSSGQPSLLESCSPTEGTVPDVKNEKVELDEGLSWFTTEQQVAVLQMKKTPPNFSSTNKRPYTDTSIETSSL